MAIPKPAIVLVLLALAGSGWWYLRAADAEPGWLGYVEAETVYVAAPVSGRLAQRSVERGARVAAGSPLFSLDPETADAEAAQLAAQVGATRAQAADLADPRQRPPDIAAARAAVASASAQLIRAGHDYDRIAALAAKGFASRAQHDAARAARDSAAAALIQARAQVSAGQISAGRAGQLRAAQAQVAASEAALRAQRQRRREIAPASPAAGQVEQTFFNPGEWVPANSPVVAILPDDRRKLRFYVPENRIARLKAGTTVRYACDSCGPPRVAKISYISPRVEFSPPVIYSERARSKLVFMVEAILPVSGQPLPPGLPVSVEPQ